jgi:transposase
MAKILVSDVLWAAIEPLLPPEPSKPRGGRPRFNDRAALAGIIFVLRLGIAWEMLPFEIGCSSVTCWRRLRDWQAAGVWTRLHRTLLECLADAERLDWSRAALDSLSVAGKGRRWHRSEPDGLRQTWHEAPWCGRPDRHTARPEPERSQSA